MKPREISFCAKDYKREELCSCGSVHRDEAEDVEDPSMVRHLVCGKLAFRVPYTAKDWYRQ